MRRKQLRPSWIRLAGQEFVRLMIEAGIEVMIAGDGWQADNVIAYLAEAHKIDAISSTDGDMLVLGISVGSHRVAGSD